MRSGEFACGQRIGILVRLSAWRQLQLGEEWKIRYVPADPRVHHPVHMTPSVTPAFVPYLVGGLCLLGGLLIWAVLRRESRLLAEGRIAPAVVTKVTDTKSEASIMHYEFPLFSGGVGNGRAMTKSKTTHVGEHVCVVYLPDEPRRNALYPLTLVKPAGYLPAERAPKRRAGRQAKPAHARAAAVIPG
ncbi:MAG: hypothetical protein KBF81_04945 [Aquabacterium sp.]|nr:hypothetical protein [Aquabacterium sp.]